MRREQWRARQAGFTLLEVLVAVIVLGLLMVGLSQGVRSGFAFWSVQNRRSSETVELDATARLLRALLTGIPVRPAAASAPGAATAIAFEGRADRLTLVGDLPTGFGDAQRDEITIALRNGRVMLDWTPHRHEQSGGAPPSPAETELIRGVDRLEFAYWGTPPGADGAAWLARWDGPALPELIRVRLGFGKGDRRRWPDLVAAPQLWAGGS